MNAFGIAYGAALAACLAAALGRWAMQSPAPIGPATSVGMIAAVSGLIHLLGWAVVRVGLSAPKDFDAAAAFRAADCRAMKTFAAGFLTGLGAVGAAVLVHAVIRPSGQERDLNTIRAGVLSMMFVGLGWIPGVVLFLWWCRPRPPEPPADPTSP